MKMLLVRRATILTSIGLLFGSFVVADDAPQPVPVEKKSMEEFTGKDAIKSRSKGGRVIEYGGEIESSGGVVPAVVQQDPLKENAKETSEKKERNINQKDSVKLITGGDPSDGNAKSGRLPVLD